MKQRLRATTGGLIDRSKTLRFSFDGVSYEGYQGDTLASALIANGVRIVGRSFKYHRRRGIVGLGAEEPNALVSLRHRDRHEPNLRASEVELYEGLRATSQNRWPSLAFDVGAINNALARFLPAGFYYKTFMWPASWWMRYERVIRRAAGLGEAPREPDPDQYFKRFAHCDVLIVGAGAAGLVAAMNAARAGARVMLVEQRAQAGGQLRFEEHTVDGLPGHEWAAQMCAQLCAMSNVRVLTQTIAFGHYDDNLIAVCEHVADHVTQPAPWQPRQRIWWVRAARVVLATGALERPIVFPGNDLPGVMLAGAAAGYAHCHAAQAGRRAVLFTNNDEAYHSAATLHRAGVAVTAIVDSRVASNADAAIGDVARRIAEDIGAQLIEQSVVCAAHGRKELNAVSVCRFDGQVASSSARLLDCDLLCTSGGWNPTVHLFSQAQGKLRFDRECWAFVPDPEQSPMASAVRCCGAANGIGALHACIGDALDVSEQAVHALGRTPAERLVAEVAHGTPGAPPQPLWEVPRIGGIHAKSFVDLQNDVTADDVRLAARENYQSVEHLKRYTTMGMGTDQGRTSNVNALAIMAQTLDQPLEQVGTTTFRPPYSPVTLSALGGIEVADRYAPLRRTPLHEWHVEAGASMQNVGLWQRARWYPCRGETMAAGVRREVRHVRSRVGIIDVSTFGKIDVRGRDAAEFLERVTINRFHNLKIGRCRYHLMLREDGFVMDDGTTTRIGEDAFYMTTTTAEAAAVLSHLEFFAQTVWPQLHVHLSDVSEQWAGIALAGPRARDVLTKVCDGDVSNDALGFMASVDAQVAGVVTRVFRISFSGELGFELHMPAEQALAVWEALREAGREFDLQAYGTEAMAVMRIEKGHVVHAELDGRALAADVGLDRMMRKDGDFVGRRALERDGFAREHRSQLVGLVAENDSAIPAGAHLVWNPTAPTPMHTYGHVTSTCFSPTLDAHIALAYIEKAPDWLGKSLYASSPLRRTSTPVRVVEPVFVDPDGARARG